MCVGKGVDERCRTQGHSMNMELPGNPLPAQLSKIGSNDSSAARLNSQRHNR